MAFQDINLDNSKTLWMGDIDEPYMDESFISSLFSGVGSSVTVKVVRDKNTGMPAGYAFIDFPSHETAERVLHAYHSLPIPNTNKKFKLNWAQLGNREQSVSQTYDQQISEAPVGYDNSIFVSDIDQSVSNTELFETFSSSIPGVISAKVVADPVTGKSRGYGFVKFATGRDCQRALIMMQGTQLREKQLRLSPATPKPGLSDTSEVYSENFIDSTGCTLFVQDLNKLYSSEEALRGFFTQFGEVAHIKVLPQHACAFVRFVSRVFADKAVSYMNECLKREEKPVLSWIKVGPTFNLKQQLSKNKSLGGGGQMVEMTSSKKDKFMKKLDVTNLNLEYSALHINQYFETTPSHFLFF